MNDGRTFGQRLRATRVKAGYSQSDLEEISGIPKARLSRYENGHVAPSIQTLERLARALGVSEASLLGDDRAQMEEFFHVLTVRGVRSPRASKRSRSAAPWQTSRAPSGWSTRPRQGPTTTGRAGRRSASWRPAHGEPTRTSPVARRALPFAPTL